MLLLLLLVLLLICEDDGNRFYVSAINSEIFSLFQNLFSVCLTNLYPGRYIVRRYV